MRFPSWLDGLTSTFSRRRTRPAQARGRRHKLASRKLSVELLEDRCVPSATYTVIDLGALGGQGSFPTNINGSGQVIGNSQNSQPRNAGFLYTPGQGMIDLGNLPPDSPDSVSATAINDLGQVVGNIPHHGFLYSSGTMTDLGMFTTAFGIKR